MPILGGQDLLRELLGAVINFVNALAVFTKVDPNRVVRLQRASNGHLLLNLCEDITNGPKGLQSGTLACLRRQTALTAQKDEEDEDLPPLVGTPHGTPPVPPPGC